jgi:hypothetical protein
MEIAVVLLMVLAERARFDLLLRRRWAALAPPRRGLAVRVPVPLALAGLDARRLLVRLSWVGIVALLVIAFDPSPGAGTYDGVNQLVGFYWAFTGLAVMAVVAATAGRDRGNELLEALPAGARSRIGSWALLLLGAATLEYLVLLVFRYYRDEPVYAALLPNAWELAQGPIMLLGGGLLGLLVARLVPGWVAVPVAVVGAVAWVGTFSASIDGATMLAPVVEWIQYHENDAVIVEPGSLAWHNAYLLGLCGLGLVAALLRERGTRRGLVLTGTAVLAATTATAVLALP